MPDLNVTVIAFYGKAKPKPLQELLQDVLGAVCSSLPPSLWWSFRSYEFAQMHGTMMGMEADLTDDGLLGRWLKTNKGESRRIDIDHLHGILQGFVQDGNPLFTFRFGGFAEAYCKCKDEHPDACHGWPCESAAPTPGVFHSCDRTPYEGSFYAFAPGPVMITGWPTDGPEQPEKFPHSLYQLRHSLEQSGLADKYHYGNDHDRRHWKDDDCFIRVGTIVGSVPAQQLRATESAVRNFLSHRRPVMIDVTIEDISFVLYDAPSLLGEHVRRIVSLKQFLDDPSTVKRLYDILVEGKGG